MRRSEAIIGYGACPGKRSEFTPPSLAKHPQFTHCHVKRRTHGASLCNGLIASFEITLIDRSRTIINHCREDICALPPARELMLLTRMSRCSNVSRNSVRVCSRGDFINRTKTVDASAIGSTVDVPG